jgi:hypothetical protein
MAELMTRKILEGQNRVFAGTGGVSPENRDLGFIPGFLDRETGLVYVSRRADGSPAPVHVLEGLPDGLVRLRTPLGRVSAVKETIVAGFIRAGCFYTREQVALALEQH